ncbi:hypothetical protein MLD38_008079 [Melastoma candidum]|uniref:Uncharacterized protein n=1 Tax=Melastoma candidum TaxID=119954 RepID=A0ACB9S1P3_9MYRT|nr:hypothetical protein MLD38_008079 [Melastoma candidum]
MPRPKMEEVQSEKVYVALGSDVQDSLKALRWSLSRFSSQQNVCFVLLHVLRNLSKNFVYGPFGKLPASSVSEGELQLLKKNERGKTDSLLSKCLSLCSKVKAEVVKVEKHDVPMCNLIVELIASMNITKLVMGFSFMKSSSSSWKTKSAVSGAFHVFRNKPEYCQLYVICGGNLVHLREENDEGIIEDDQGTLVAKLKEKSSLRVWFGKMFTESNTTENKANNAFAGAESPELGGEGDPWKRHEQEIEDYFQELLSSYREDEDLDTGETGDMRGSPTRSDIPELADSNKSAAEKFGLMKVKVEEARRIIEEKKKEANADVERRAKQNGLLVDDLKVHIKDEITSQVALGKDIEAEKERISEVKCGLEESRSRLSTLRQLQFELSNKLQMSILARANAEGQLEKSVKRRAEMLREIEELRRQRDVLRRRVGFCKEKDVIGLVNGLNESGGEYREYTKEQIRLATNDFADNLRVRSGGEWTNVYKGRISHATAVAIKNLTPAHGLPVEVLLAKVESLSCIRHPNLSSVIGFCPELRCVVLEYMHRGSLRDALSSPNETNQGGSRPLWWHKRINIAHDICQGLVFLHSAKPRPVIHGSLSVSKVLLDRNLVAKIGDFGLVEFRDQNDLQSDIRGFGDILLALLRGGQDGSIEDAMEISKRGGLAEMLDKASGQWPLHLAGQLLGITVRCLSVNADSIGDFSLTTVLDEIREIRRAGEEIAARSRNDSARCRETEGDDTRDVPRVFFCPIFQEIMKDPFVAADGFSYELEAIREWLVGHDTSPMTNLKLQHKNLIPNHTLRSFIEEWGSKRCTSS